MEVGCGCGNTVFPLMEENGIPFYFACDFSPRAVNFVKVMKFEFDFKSNETWKIFRFIERFVWMRIINIINKNMHISKF